MARNRDYFVAFFTGTVNSMVSIFLKSNQLLIPPTYGIYLAAADTKCLDVVQSIDGIQANQHDAIWNHWSKFPENDQRSEADHCGGEDILF